MKKMDHSGNYLNNKKMFLTVFIMSEDSFELIKTEIKF